MEDGIEYREMLARVDLDLEPKLDDRRNLGLHTVAQRHIVGIVLPTWRSQDGIEPRSDGVQNRADGARGDLNTVDVFGIAMERRDEQFVDGRPAAQEKGRADVRSYALDELLATNFVIICDHSFMFFCVRALAVRSL